MLILLPLNSLMKQIAERGRRAKGKQSTSTLTSSTSAPHSDSNAYRDSPNQDGGPESAAMPNFAPANYQHQPQFQPQSQPQSQSQSQSTASTSNQTLDNPSALFNFDFGHSIFTDGNDFGSLPWSTSDLESLQQALEIDPVFFTTP